MSKDPITGVMPRKAFEEAVKAPAGGAKKIIRKYDPLWGLGPDEKIPWKVMASISATGTATVFARTEEEANQLAEKLHHNDYDWDCDFHDDFDIVSVKISEP